MKVLRICLLPAVCLLLLFLATHEALAETPQPSDARRSPLDDTAGIINVSPDTTLVLACTQVTLTLDITVTDARVFDLLFSYDTDRLQFLSSVPGTEPTLYVMPPSVTGGVITIDAFFHPNFTGNTQLIALTFYVKPTTGDDTTIVAFTSGQGYSGTESNPIPIQWTGDQGVILIEGTPPDPPSELLITRLNYPAHADSVLLQWHPVFWDIDGDTLINPLYVIFREHAVANPGVYDSIGATPDTFFYDTSIILDPDFSSVKNASTLQVRARKTQP